MRGKIGTKLEGRWWKEPQSEGFDSFNAFCPETLFGTHNGGADFNVDKITK